MQRAFFGEAQPTFGGSGPGAKDPKLYLSPVHLGRALRELGVRDRRAVLDQHYYWDLPDLYPVPASAFVPLAALVGDPKPGREIHVPDRNVLHQRGDQDVLTEHVLVLDEPRGGIFGVLEEQ